MTSLTGGHLRELLPLAVMRKPARETVAVLNDTDNDSDDEDVTSSGVPP